MPRSRRIGAAVCTTVLAVALAGCATAEHESPAQIAAPFRKGVLASERDLGSRSDQESVRRAAVAALSDEATAFVVSPRLRGKEPAEVLAAMTGSTAARERLALLERARSETLAAGLQDSFSFFARQDFGPAWTGTGSRASFLDHDVWSSSAFHVDAWQGVQVVGGTARVLVRGENRGVDWGGEAARAGWAQYKLILRRDTTAPNGWCVVREQAASTAA